MSPSGRRLGGIVLILLLIAIWCALVVTIAEWMGDMPWPLAILFYLVAGTAWILPLKPLIRWMQTGKWRDA